MLTIKKYSNRRLYDTSESRYITLDELAAKIRGGVDAQVVDARSGADLTQATLAQIIIEGRGAGKLLPVPLLTQLIRMGDDSLSEFFGQYISVALQLYLQMKQNARRVAPFYPMANVPFSAANAMARAFMGHWMSRAGGNPYAAGAAPGAWPGGNPWQDPQAWPGAPGGAPFEPAQPPQSGEAFHGFDGPTQPDGAAPDSPLTTAPAAPAPSPEAAELAALRREFEALKRSLRGDEPDAE